MQGTIRIGRVFGFDVSAHWSWFFIFFLITATFSTHLLHDFYPQWTAAQRWLAGALISAVFFVSILLHEMAHSILARRYGIPVSSITLFVFGGVSNLTKEPEDPRQEFWIAVVGPLTSIAIAAVFGLGYVVLRPLEQGAASVSANLAVINLVLGVFNLLPGFPLDGGRVLRSIFWARRRSLLDATRVASNVGQTVAYGIMGIGVVAFLLGDLITGIWFFLIGNFLRNASAASYEQLFADRILGGISASAVTRHDYVELSPAMTLAELAEQHVLTGHGRSFPVVAGQELLGLITLTDLRRTPRESWQTTTVYRAMTPFNELKTVEPSDDMAKVLALMTRDDLNQIPLVERKILLGLIQRADVLRFVQLQQEVSAASGDH